jgi:hypothetical protein
MAKYWMSPLDKQDDFGDAYTNFMVDGKTKMGPWANMTEASYKKYGIGKLGTGYGQRYEKQADTGKWLKVEG